ncbi:MAG: EamA family transporter, partial [Sphingobium sp.]|nr:EamA family transporter [Sphingobium sp.]
MASSTPTPPMNIPRLAFPALILANIMLSLGPVMVRLADVGPVAAASWRLTLALPVLLLLAIPRLKRTPPTRGEWGVMLLAGVVFAGDLAAWHLGIIHTKVANATLFGNMSALLLPAWALLVLRQRPTRIQAIALLLAGVGALVLMGGSYDLAPINLRGDLLCLLAGILYTAYILIIQRARGRLDSWSVLAVS